MKDFSSLISLQWCWRKGNMQSDLERCRVVRIHAKWREMMRSRGKRCEVARNDAEWLKRKDMQYHKKKPAAKTTLTAGLCKFL